MFARMSLRLPTNAVRCLSSSTPVRALQHTPMPGNNLSFSPVSEGEKVWCDVYGVDYEKQIAESVHECPAQAVAVKINYSTLSDTKGKSKPDVWNVVVEDKSSK
ncbi:uncharacterized protein PHALS_02345 [Plasmopara halstedii]|uniref:Uncharacterized protein n=1 Tax=Plasmopara halstedii TaxID=4781 RepID=A0A0P1AY27_PLAHL|nr:uncharacterized protein PHALS_02345 [Plasmopara halstedii]CEG46018.1 hypothetical protein PHALS_02345 [Plasmopara halstedii]|eukprot:XP_024582387.1 hypothetical protein PHALS_02345 [Plasmopara halstedii]